MALTTAQIWAAVSLDPSHLNIYNDDEAAAQAAAIALLDTWRVPQLANAEVAVPVKAASGSYGWPLPDDVILARYPAYTSAQIATELSEFADLYDGAVVSYARWEINKRVFSDSDEYDEDADESRQEGDAQLKKLVGAITPFVAAADAAAAAKPKERTPLRSRGVSLRKVW